MSNPVLNETLAVRFLDLLRVSADSDGRGHVTNRALGGRLNCSIGNFPRLWRMLVAKQILVIENSDRMGTTYRLLQEGELPARPAPDPLLVPQRQKQARTVLDDLERLGRLKERGLLTEREYVVLKRRLLADGGSE